MKKTGVEWVVSSAMAAAITFLPSAARAVDFSSCTCAVCDASACPAPSMVIQSGECDLPGQQAGTGNGCYCCAPDVYACDAYTGPPYDGMPTPGSCQQCEAECGSSPSGGSSTCCTQAQEAWTNCESACNSPASGLGVGSTAWLCNKVPLCDAAGGGGGEGWGGGGGCEYYCSDYGVWAGQCYEGYTCDDDGCLDDTSCYC